METSHTHETVHKFHHVYEISNLASSRSIDYVLHELQPSKHIMVETPTLTVQSL